MFCYNSPRKLIQPPMPLLGVDKLSSRFEVCSVAWMISFRLFPLGFSNFSVCKQKIHIYIYVYVCILQFVLRIFKSWSIVDLQYCVHFRYSVKWFCYTYIYIYVYIYIYFLSILFHYSLLQDMEFSRQEYWSELPRPSPGEFPTQGSNPISWIGGRFFTVWATREDKVPCAIQ